MPQPHICSRHGTIPFELPASWQLSTLARFDDHQMQPDITALCAAVLDNPIGTRPLRDSVSSHHTVAILVEDLTRTSPKKIILQCLLASLKQMGVGSDHIRIVMALGTHRGLSEEELSTAFGPDIVRDYTFINHDCNAKDLVAIGRLSSGTEVKINRIVYEADFRIGIGSIFPHPMNGFGGGGKILFPGVADYTSIFEHHLRHSFRDRAVLGMLEGNAFYAEVCALALAGRLDFILNSVLDHQDRLYHLVGGHPTEAHRAGVDICKGIITQKFRSAGDVTVISSFPYSEGPQIMKPLAPAGMITRKGGTIVLYADCTVPLPEVYYQACEAFRQEHAGRLGPAVLEHFTRQKPIIPGSPPELNMSLAQCLLALHDFAVILVTRDIPKSMVQRLGFGYANTLDQAIHIVAKQHATPAVNIVPSGGVILPVVAEQP